MGTPVIEFGANEWLVDEMYERYLVDKNSVDQSWWPILEGYHPVTDPTPTSSIPVVQGPVAEQATAVEPVETAGRAAAAPPPSPPRRPARRPIARTTSAPAKPQPIPAEAPQTAQTPVVEGREPVEPQSTRSPSSRA